MSAVVQLRKSKYNKHNDINKTKSACSSTSLSSTEGNSLGADTGEKAQKYPPAKMLPRSESGKLSKESKMHQEDFFSWIDPLPAKPPSYKSSNPSRRVTFPVYETLDDGSLPGYSPAVEAITVVSMKLEWLDPYTCSPSRSWKNFVMEINSTQLNFYLIDPALTRGIKNYCNGKSHFGGEHLDPSLEYESHHSIFSSLSSKNTYQFNKADQECISKKISNNKSKYLTDNKLFRSYSLQFAKYGIPTDYNRKTFVLRVRCETEQFMLSFSHVDDMIMWNMYLSIGIGVSLDLDFRELPTYRTVPRRRRRRRRKRNNGLMVSGDSQNRTLAGRRKSSGASGSRSNLELNLNQRKRPGSIGSTDSSSATSSRRGSNDSIKSKLKSFFGSENKVFTPTYRGSHTRTLSVAALNSVTEDDEEDHSAVASGSNTPNGAVAAIRPSLEQRSKSMGPLESSPAADDYFGFIHGARPSMGIAATTPGSPCSEVSVGGATINSNDLQVQTGFHSNTGLQNDLNELQQVIYEHNEGVEEETEESPVSENNDNDDDDDDDADDADDIDSVHPNSTTQATSIYQEEGIFHDSEDDYYYVVDRNDAFRRRASSVTSNLSSTPYGSGDVKWHPPRKEMSRRRYIRDSLRCIKPLPDNEEWLGKVLIRPVSAPDYDTNNPPISGFVGGTGKSGKSKASPNKSSKSDKGVILQKCKNHYAKPYIVGPVGLLKTNARC